MTSAPDNDHRLSLTPRAAIRIKSILADEPEGSMLRVSVNGGGCSGFQYDFGIAHVKAQDDIVIERDGAIALVDQVSLPFLQGSTIDFVDDLMGQAFKIHNPNATASCGCGTSFSL
jgi:iron-sulfur cluster assembly accessory protein